MRMRIVGRSVVSSAAVNVILERCFQDLVTDTNTLLVTHGFPLQVVCPKFIRYWLQQGKTPEQVAMIALGRRRAADAHEGGVER